jgi:predicted GIY-YIG superfamily endonuclease
MLDLASCAFRWGKATAWARALDDRATLQRHHYGESAQRNLLCGRNQPSRSARVSASQRGRLAVHREIRRQDARLYEHYGDVREAIAREKQLKKCERRWKLELIERFNPDWRDLYETLNI